MVALLELELLFLTLTFALYSSCAYDLPEGTQISLESTRTLLPNREWTRKITEEITEIRNAYDEIQGIVHQPKFIPGKILVSGKIEESNFQRLNQSEYGPISANPIGTIATVINFRRPYHPEVLAQRLLKEFGIKANADFSVGRSNIISYNIQKREYSFCKGSGDCPSGCVTWFRWIFREFDDGKIRLVSS